MAEIIVDFSYLREKSKIVYETISRQLGLTKPIGVFLIDTDKLTQPQRELLKWNRHPEEPTPASEPQPETAAPAEEQIDMALLEEENRKDIEKRVHIAQAENRLRQYEDEQGLVRDADNQNLIIKFVNDKAKGYFSAPAIDAAIMNLRNQLHWKPKVGVIVQPPQETGEVLGFLPSGEKELSLKTAPPRSSSVSQVRDWLARYRKSTGQIYIRQGGSFSR